MQRNRYEPIKILQKQFKYDDINKSIKFINNIKCTKYINLTKNSLISELVRHNDFKTTNKLT